MLLIQRKKLSNHHQQTRHTKLANFKILLQSLILPLPKGVMTNVSYILLTKSAPKNPLENRLQTVINSQKNNLTMIIMKNNNKKWKSMKIVRILYHPIK